MIVNCILHYRRSVSAFHLMPVRVNLLLLLRRNLYTIVYPQQTRRRLQRGLQTLNLTHRGLQNAGLPVVNHFTVDKVETIIHEPSLGIVQRGVLGSVMVCTELGDEVGRVLGGIDGKSLRDGEEGSGEFGDGKLFSRALRKCQLISNKILANNSPK